jgi:hypothetical protein
VENNLEQPVVQQSVMQQSSVDEIPKSKSKFKLILLIIILLLIVGGAYYFGTKQDPFLSQNRQGVTPTVMQISPTLTPDLTADWQIYDGKVPLVVTNIEIKYPQGWKLKEPTSVNNFDDSLLYFLSNGKLDGAEDQPYVYVRGLQDLSKSSFKDLVTASLSEDLKGNFNYAKTSLNGITLYKTESLPSRLGCQFSFFTKDEVTYIEVSLCPFNSKNPFSQQNYYLNIYNQILSTFKFTDQNQADPTANWKTYVSKNYGYELKYPSDWNYSSEVMGEGFGKNFVKNSDDFSCSLNISAMDTANFDGFMAQSRATQKQNSVNVKTSEINNENNVALIKDESPDSIKAQGIYASYYIKNEKGKFSYHIYTDINKNIINKDGDRVVYGTVNDQNCLNIFDQILSTFKFKN